MNPLDHRPISDRPFHFLPCLALVLLLGIGLSDGVAQAQDDGPHPGGANGVEVALGLSYNSEDHVEVQAFALRWNRHLRGPWSFELALSTDDLGDIERSNRFFEISARRQFLGQGRWRLLGFVGVGAVLFDAPETIVLDASTGLPVTSPLPGQDVVFVERDTGDRTRPSAHVGAAFEFDFTNRVYLRTDLRLQRNFNVVPSASEHTAATTFGLGWRF